MLRIIISAMLVLSPLISAQDGFVTKTFDLKVLNQALHEDPEFRLELPLLSEFAIGESDDSDGSDHDIDGLLDQLSELLQVEGLLDQDADDSLRALNESVVAIRAEPARAQAAIEFLERCQRRLLRSVIVEIFPLDRESFAALPGARLSAAGCRNFLDARPNLAPALYRMRLGRRENLKATQRSSVLGDYHVEVAEKAFIADPVIRSLFEGMDLSLVVDERLDGRFHINLASRAAERLDRSNPRRISSPHRGVGTIELPVCASQLFRASGDVELGGALAVGSDAASGQSFLLRLKAVDAPVPQEGKLAVYSVGDLSRWLSRQALPYIPVPGVVSRESSYVADECDEEATAAINSDNLEELMGQGGVYEGDGDGYVMSLKGSLWLSADAGAQQRFASLVRELAEPLQRCLDYELRWQFVDSSDFARMARTDIETWAPKLSNRTLLSARVGDVAMAVMGKETAYVIDKEVEIASDASIARPVMDTTFSGSALRLFSSCNRDGQAAVSAEVMIQEMSPNIVEIPTHIKELGSIDAVSGQRLSAHPRFLTQTNQWNLLMARELPGTTTVAVMTLRVN